MLEFSLNILSQVTGHEPDFIANQVSNLANFAPQHPEDRFELTGLQASSLLAKLEQRSPGAHDTRNCESSTQTAIPRPALPSPAYAKKAEIALLLEEHHIPFNQRKRRLFDLFKRESLSPKASLKHFFNNFYESLITGEARKIQELQKEMLSTIREIRSFVYQINFDDMDSNLQRADFNDFALSHDVLLLLTKSFHLFEMEAQEELTYILTYLVKQFNYMPPDRASESIRYGNEIAHILVHSFDNTLLTLNHMRIIKMCLKNEHLSRYFLTPENIYPFLDVFFKHPNFEVSGYAISIIEKMLQKRQMANATKFMQSQGIEPFMERHFEDFNDRFKAAITEGNFLIMVEGLKVYYEFLVSRPNPKFLYKFIANPDNLEWIMDLMRVNWLNNREEAFNIFKLFAQVIDQIRDDTIISPDIRRRINEILRKNKLELTRLLEENLERVENAFFQEESRKVIDTISRL